MHTNRRMLSGDNGPHQNEATKLISAIRKSTRAILTMGNRPKTKGLPLSDRLVHLR